MICTIKPYQINVSDAALKTLQDKLELTAYPGETNFTNDWKYGASFQDIKRLVGHWKAGFDWRRAEAGLNELPHFTTTISIDGHEDDLKIHFIHGKSKNANSIPLLFVHGWAGSFIEVSKILPLLTKTGDDRTPSFHVVAPSLPNCGFSQRTSKPGFGVLQHAEVCHKLMLQLGYNEYGGDWGFLITRAMGLLYSNNILATHLNFILTPPPSPLITPLLVLQYPMGRLTPTEKEGLKRTKNFTENGSGYNKIQKTRPHTLGFALADSPVALLAWLYEKLHDWTDDYKWNDDETLTWVSIYFFSDAVPDASIRLYYDIVNPTASASVDGKTETFMKYNTVSLSSSYFPKDVIVLPRSWGRMLGPVAFEKRHTEGGHFAAYEKPNLLVADVRDLIKNVGVPFGSAD